MKKGLLFVLGTFLILSQGHFAHSKGLLGEKYVSLAYESVSVEDPVVKKIDDSLSILAAKLSFPVNTNVQTSFGLEYKTLSGSSDLAKYDSDAYAIGTGLSYHFNPENAFDPYVGVGIGYQFVKATAKAHEFDLELAAQDDDYFWNLSVGAEIRTNGDFSVIPSVTYAKVGDQDGSTSVGVGIHKWLTENFGLRASVGYNTDSESTGILGGITFGF